MRQTQGQSKHDLDLGNYLPLVRRIARKISRRLPPSVCYDDLEGAGNLGLVEASMRYDPALNDNFEAYAERRIRGAILDEIRAMDWAPRAVRRRAQSLRRAEDQLTATLGRPPEQVELADVMHLNTAALHKMQQELRQVLLMDHDVLDHSSPSTLPAPSSRLLHDERIGQIVSAIDGLPERERQVVAMYYLEELKLREIGQLMGVTESRICQMHTRALKRLFDALSQEEGFVESLAA